MKTMTLPVALWLFIPALAAAQFSDTGQTNNEYARTDPGLVAWADQVVGVTRGYQDYQQPALGTATYGLASDCLGATGTPVSLGDGGSRPRRTP